MKINQFISTVNRKVKMRYKSYWHSKKLNRVREKILHYYSEHPTADSEIESALGYLKNHQLTTFYGDFQEKYNANDVEVFTDLSNGLSYVNIENKKLYFKRKYNKRTVQLLFNGLRIEQDRQCPHCYTDDEFVLSNNDILADIGCAEGIFTLLNIETMKKAYLFEQDPEWIEALEATFKPWREKIEIVPKFVSNVDTEIDVSLDRFFGDNSEKPNFLKVDVEGAELRVLEGMPQLLLQKNLKMALCTYHHREDFAFFSRYLKEKNFQFKANPNVMIFLNDLDAIQPPFFRKCLIKAHY